MLLLSQIWPVEALPSWAFCPLQITPQALECVVNFVITTYSSLTLYFLCPSPGRSHFSMETLFLRGCCSDIMGSFMKAPQVLSGYRQDWEPLVSVLQRETTCSQQGIFLFSPVISGSDSLLRFRFLWAVSLAESGLNAGPWPQPQRVQFRRSALQVSILTQVDPRPCLEKMPEVTLRIRGFFWCSSLIL